MTTPGSLPTTVSPAPTGERVLIDRIRDRLPQPSPPLIVGIGDDGAVVKPERGALEVLTTDALVEGVHFDRRYSSLEDIGYRAMAVNVSDLAAMGAAPRLALWSLILPDWVTADDVDRLADGAGQMAREAGLALAGGNLTRTPGPLVVDRARSISPPPWAADDGTARAAARLADDRCTASSHRSTAALPASARGS